jgi:hypothetical protein
MPMTGSDYRRIQKARSRFPGAGLILAMLSIAGDLPDVPSFLRSCLRATGSALTGRAKRAPDERLRKATQRIDIVVCELRLHINACQRQHPLKDRRQANQHHKQFEKICQASFSDKFIDGPKTNRTDHANNQNPDQD